MDKLETQKLAERIAILLEEKETDDGAYLRASLEKINQRLDRIESQILLQNPQSAFPNPQSFHPSQQKFEIADALTLETSENFETEKACPYEPTGKPCDHCAMCSSRGF